MARAPNRRSSQNDRRSSTNRAPPAISGERQKWQGSKSQNRGIEKSHRCRCADVRAVTRRLIATLLDTTGHFAPPGAKWCERKKGFEIARAKLLARINDSEKDGSLGWRAVLRYLGNGAAI